MCVDGSEKVQCEVTQNHKQPVKYISSHVAPRLSAFHFYFSNLFHNFHRDKKPSVFPSALTLGIDIERPLLCVVKQAHIVGANGVERRLHRSWSLWPPCLNHAGYLSLAPVCLSEKQCTAWLPDQVSSYVLKTHRGNYRVPLGPQGERYNTPGSSKNEREASLEQDPVII